jgi:protein O-mannosyl-transferase
MPAKKRVRPKSRFVLAPQQELRSLPEAAGPRWRAALIAAAVLLAYWNSFSGPFVFDDVVSVVENRQIREWWHVGGLVSSERELPVAGRPLVNASFALNFAVGGLDVRGYHAWNLGVHLICALLVFGVVRRTLQQHGLRARFESRSLDLAFAVALLWALHPLNTEAVDYVTQRTETMMSAFFLATLYTAIRAGTASSGWRWQLASVLCCALGMACKESMVTAPVMVALYDRVFVFASIREAVRRRWRLYAGLAATWVVLVLLLLSGPRVHSAGLSAGVDVWTYLLNQTVMIVRYLRLSVWPWSLVVNYGWPVPLTLGDVLPYAITVVGLLVVTLVALFRWPPLGFLGAWLFLTLAPTSSVVPIATEVGAERRMYLPLISVIAAAVVGGAAVWNRLMAARGESRPSTHA